MIPFAAAEVLPTGTLVQYVLCVTFNIAVVYTVIQVTRVDFSLHIRLSISTYNVRRILHSLWKITDSKLRDRVAQIVFSQLS